VNSGKIITLPKYGGITTRVPTDYIINNYKHINPDVNPNINNTIFPKTVELFSLYSTFNLSFRLCFVSFCFQFTNFPTLQRCWYLAHILTMTSFRWVALSFASWNKDTT
jgi:hypothetical protein